MADSDREEPQLHILIDGDISLVDAEAVARDINTRYAGIVKVCPRVTFGTPVPAEPVTEVVGVAGAVASIVSAIVVILSMIRDHNKRKEWTVDRLKALVAKEMLRNEVVGFNVTCIKNFDDLLHHNPSPCVLEIVDNKKSEKYKLFVFQDGRSYVIRVKEAEQQR